MTTNELHITKDSVVDVEDDAQLLHASEKLYHLVGFTLDDCTVALLNSAGHVGHAAEYLTTGAWQTFKSVSWNWQELDAACQRLLEKTGRPEFDCLTTLKNCYGNEALAERKLLGLPALP